MRGCESQELSTGIPSAAEAAPYLLPLTDGLKPIHLKANTCRCLTLYTRMGHPQNDRGRGAWPMRPAKLALRGVTKVQALSRLPAPHHAHLQLHTISR